MHFTPLLLLAALGVSAHPSGHAHMHRAFHDKKDGQVIHATIDGKLVSWTQGGSPFKHAHKPTKPASAPPPPATPTAAAPPAPTAAAPGGSSGSDASAGGSGQGLSTYSAFGGCAASRKRASAYDISYKGNTGCNGYGSNIKLIQSHLAPKYKYTIKVTVDKPSECKIWNKIGNTGEVNGFFAGMGATSFNMQPGDQWIAFDANTQGGLVCFAGGVPLTTWGEFNGPWAEFDFESGKNNGWSGFDASAIVPASVGGPFAPLKLCSLSGDGTCSSLDSNGGGVNAFLGGDEHKDGIGGNIAPGPLSLHADFRG